MIITIFLCGYIVMSVALAISMFANRYEFDSNEEIMSYVIFWPVYCVFYMILYILKYSIGSTVYTYKKIIKDTKDMMND